MKYHDAGPGRPALVTADEYLDARTRAWIDGQRRLWLEAELEGGVRYDPLTGFVTVAPQHTTVCKILVDHIAEVGQAQRDPSTAGRGLGGSPS